MNRLIRMPYFAQPLSLIGVLSVTVAGLMAQESAVIRTLDPTPKIGAITAFSETSGVTVRMSGNEENVPADQIISIQPPSQKSAPLNQPALIVLAGGDELRGTIRGGDSEQILIELPSVGVLTVGIDFVDGLSFGPGGQSPLPLAAYGDSPQEQDVLYRRTDAGIDSLSGLVESFGRESLTFQSTLGTVEFNYKDVAAVRIVPVAPLEQARKTPVAIDLVGGSIIRGNLKSLDMSLVTVSSRFQKELQFPLVSVERIRFENSGHAYLSDLSPSSVSQIPFIGDSQDFRFPWVRDATVTGSPLIIGGRRFSKGIGVHSKCRLDFEVTGYSRFEVSVGVCDEVLSLLHHGSVVFRVFVDEKVAFESGMVRGGEGVLAIDPISLDGANILGLEVDFGDDYDVADRAAWVDPIVIR